MKVRSPVLGCLNLCLRSFLASLILQTSVLPGRADDLSDVGARKQQLLRTLFERRLSSAGPMDNEAESAGCVQRTINVAGIKRTFLIHVPSSFQSGKTVPLIMVFHGGFGDGARMVRVTQFNPISDREDFIVVYPNGIRHHWNDGRGEGETAAGKTDDVAFVRAMIDTLSREYNIDQRRIFATGISNGGNLSHKLGAELSDKIAAIAPVAGCIGTELATTFAPSQSVSVLQIHGTEDRGIPWNGGKIVGGRVKGETLSVADTLSCWIKADGCATSPSVSQQLEDRDRSDGTTASITRYTGGKNGTEVALIKIQGGGHNWPGTQTDKGMLTDKVCRDFNASEEIWSFFKSHPKQRQ
jgi:polyhydroxybutyrate depolymerase